MFATKMSSLHTCPDVIPVRIVRCQFFAFGSFYEVYPVWDLQFTRPENQHILLVQVKTSSGMLHHSTNTNSCGFTKLQLQKKNNGMHSCGWLVYCSHDCAMFGATSVRLALLPCYLEWDVWQQNRVPWKKGLGGGGGGGGGLSTGGIYMRYYGTSVQVDLY